MKKIIFPLIIALFILIYFMGPNLYRGHLDLVLPVIDVDINNVEKYVATYEANFDIKKNNESVILWADSVSRPTEYVLLYLHGFTASRYEGYPITHDFVKEFKTNAYLPRLYGHGLNTDNALRDMTPDALYDSAKESLIIASKLGNKVVIMGTSTGCTLALMLAADYPKLVDALILYSPNIAINNIAAPLLSYPWGLELSRLVHRGKYCTTADVNGDGKYWYLSYRLEAQVYLQQLLDARMKREEFKSVKQPTFVGYYYKDKYNQDETVSVNAIRRMYRQLGTPVEQKVAKAFPDAGDHVIACELKSNSIEAVRDSTFSFVRDVLKL